MSKYASDITDVEYRAIRFAQENGMSDDEINQARMKKGKLPVNFDNFNVAVLESEPDAVTAFGTAAVQEFTSPMMGAAEALGLDEEVGALKRLFGAEEAKSPTAAAAGRYTDDLFYTVGGGYAARRALGAGAKKVYDTAAKSKIAKGAGYGIGGYAGFQAAESLFGLGGSAISNALAGALD